MGRQGDRQGDLMVMWSEMPRSPGHVFYDRLQQVLVDAGFDGFVEAASEYAKSHGRSAKHVMNPSSLTVLEEMPLAELAALLERKRANSLPVVRAGQLVGIV